MHIFDRPECRTPLDQVVVLLQALTSPVRTDNRSPQEIADDFAKVVALAVLCPLPAVRRIRPAYEAERRTDMDVALFFRIPQTYIPFVMSDHFERAIEVVKGAPSFADYKIR